MTMVLRSDNTPKPGAGALLPAYLLLAVFADAAVLAVWAAGAQPATVALLAHLLLVCGIWLIRDVRQDCTIAAVATLSILAMGPLGALGTLFLTHHLRHGQRPEAAFADMHRRRSAPTEPDTARALCNAVREGRAFATEGSRARRFADVLADGTVSEKQALLGTISKNFHPDYLPVLQAALRSDQAQVRVLAAAVFTKLHESLHGPVKAIKAEAQTRSADADDARVLAAATRSGLLSSPDVVRAREAAIDILLVERPSVGPLDDTEVLLCSLLQEADRHNEVEARLGQYAEGLPAALKAILLSARMRSRQYEGIPSLAAEAGEIAALDANRRSAQKRPLLALGDHGQRAAVRPPDSGRRRERASKAAPPRRRRETRRPG